ncbi:efflux RND transporter periplasmic adaptor subunit [Undibacterium sp. RuRC25W]|uniref:efflux RND transporter periplasmic adaptor subunit n=1 Tax=Undibacterium sp. RuRC25W TaxID=3413047 RepID=UPI003BF188D7
MLRLSLMTLAITLVLAGCNKDKQNDAKEGASAALTDQPLLVTQEDLLLIHSNALSSGPVITGSVEPERKADLRAELSSVVLQVFKENGETVKRGDLLVRLDDTSIKDSLHSAEEAERAAVQTFDQAERQFQRLKTLRASGMTSTQQLEDAEIRRNNTQSDLVAAKARTVQARQQLQRTEIRAPFDGVVSERKVSAGDTAQLGKELVKVIDPTSLRFEGLVSADKINNVKIGQSVRFHINGYGEQEFSGKVKRIDLAANATTRQVEVLVSFDDKSLPRVSGLYAEGLIESTSTQTLTIASSALVREGDKSYAWLVKDGHMNKVILHVGQRDARHGDYAVQAGLKEGDKVIRNPISTLKEGQKLSLVASASSQLPQAVPGIAPQTVAIPAGK